MESILLAVNTMSPVKNNPRLALEPVVYTPQETVPFSFTGVSQTSSFDTPTQVKYLILKLMECRELKRIVNLKAALMI